MQKTVPGGSTSAPSLFHPSLYISKTWNPFQTIFAHALNCSPDQSCKDALSLETLASQMRLQSVFCVARSAAYSDQIKSIVLSRIHECHEGQHGEQRWVNRCPNTLFCSTLRWDVNTGKARRKATSPSYLRADWWLNKVLKASVITECNTNSRNRQREAGYINYINAA